MAYSLYAVKSDNKSLRAGAIRELIYMIHLDRQRSLDLFEQALDPTDDSLRKIINLATVELMKKWNHAVQNWYMCLTQLAIQFPERVPLDLAL